MVDSDPWQQLQMQTKDLDEESYDQQQGNDADPEQDLKQQKDIKKKPSNVPIRSHQARRSANHPKHRSLLEWGLFQSHLQSQQVQLPQASCWARENENGSIY